MTEHAPEQYPLDSPVSALTAKTHAVSQSQILGRAPVSGFLRVADLTDQSLGDFRLLRRLGA